MKRALLLLSASLCLFATAALAGGPLIVGGPAVGNRPAFGVDGEPFTWDPAQMPIRYRIDPGPMAATASGTAVVTNTVGVQRVQAMTDTWQNVSTAAISFSNSGPLLPAGSYTGGDLRTADQFNAVIGSCQAGGQSPVIFDANGQILAQLGLPPEVIGFASLCRLDNATGHILNAAVVMNGRFQDGVETLGSGNFELTVNEFDQAITHEIGHLTGLDHSQINLDALTNGGFPCDADRLAGLPLMFPFLLCQARVAEGLPRLSADDIAAISSLYPNSSRASAYGTISGTIFFADGVSHVQGANVVARLLDDPATEPDESRRVAVSTVSGYRFTGNPGQSVTASLPDPLENNTNGDPAGSRKPQLIGRYELSVPPGTYTIEVESIPPFFAAGSSVGPLDPPVDLPGQPEFWNENESAFDFLLQRDPITVHAGESITDIDIILNIQFPRFDEQEDGGAWCDPPLLAPDVQGREVRG
jgi:hypothetical protein